MKVEQLCWTDVSGWSVRRGPPVAADAQLVLAFGAIAVLGQGVAVAQLRSRYPGATLIGCSTAGEICDTSVQDDTVSAVAIHFEHTRLRMVHAPLDDAAASAATGALLADRLTGDNLVHVFVLAEGLHVNGSELVKGFVDRLPPHVALTGGLAGDGARFGRTVICVNGEIRDRAVAAIGFYGDRLHVGYGSLGGWDQFGPDRLITKATGNVLYELDGKPALELYRTYLGPYAAQLPSSGLLFPLSVSGGGGKPGVVRTILGIDEAAGSMTFAGDLPEGSYARLMRANIDRLIDGATGAATASYEVVGSIVPDLAVLISCVGRKLVLKQRVEEEVESVRSVLGEGAVLTGFYSYGEIAPFAPLARCDLHNQTMTITTFSER